MVGCSFVRPVSERAIQERRSEANGPYIAPSWLRVYRAEQAAGRPLAHGHHVRTVAESACVEPLGFGTNTRACASWGVRGRRT
jgi:hypothetical protein